MRSGHTIEASRLANTERLLVDLSGKCRRDPLEARFQILEGVASLLGDFNLAEYHRVFGTDPVAPTASLLECAQQVAVSLSGVGIPPPLAVSALARESMDRMSRRRQGAYHTDFRIAQHLARNVRVHLHPKMRVVDPAAGAGILLTAISLEAKRAGLCDSGSWFRESLYAADLSPTALRGTLLSLACLTSRVADLEIMRAKWKVQDSLLASPESWDQEAQSGFDLVVANPPWEKIKLSRHEFLLGNGSDRMYGSPYDDSRLRGYVAARDKQAERAATLAARYPKLRSGEPDLYVAFIYALLELARREGTAAFIVPAGLIRSQRTRDLRSLLTGDGAQLSVTVLDNRARYFPIDTRFKFLMVCRSGPRDGRASPVVHLRHGKASAQTIVTTRTVRISVKSLRVFRPDLTIPEVRSKAEWKLFRDMQSHCADVCDDSNAWHARFAREVDMTRDRRHFERRPSHHACPVIEGRMVQSHRLGCKKYVSGQGRSARWMALVPGSSSLQPQYWLPANRLTTNAQRRVRMQRAGFCDITGQTNERSMMAALIPAGVVCGNKVPTVAFPNDPSSDRLFLWLAIVNSLPYDWLLRRVVTTTVNYFVVRSIRLPDVPAASAPGTRLCAIARQLAELDVSGPAVSDVLWRMAGLRAEADAIVAELYGCSENDVQLILSDFPLRDGKQPAIRGETRSTVSADLLLAKCRERQGLGWSAQAERLAEARSQGAIPYLANEFVAGVQRFYGGDR